MDSRHLGIVSVSGLRRSPLPAARMKAFILFGATHEAGTICSKGARRSFVTQTRNKGPAHPAFLVAVDKRIIGHHVNALEIKPKRHFAQTELPHRFADLFLVPFFAEEQKKTTPASSGDLAAQSPILARRGVRLIDERI